MELTIDQQKELINKFKKDLICKDCQKELVNKDYKINKRNLKLFGLAYLGGILIGGVIGYYLFA